MENQREGPSGPFRVQWILYCDEPGKRWREWHPTLGAGRKRKAELEALGVHVTEPTRRDVPLRAEELSKFLTRLELVGWITKETLDEKHLHEGG